jgi:alpha-L-fucosidase
MLLVLCLGQFAPSVWSERAWGVSKGQDTAAEVIQSSPSRQECLEWFQDMRYGMFIHWGPSVIHGGRYAYTDLSWSRGENPPDPWCGGGPIPPDIYDHSYRSFNPTAYDPAAWVQLAKEAGMRYIVMTARHHDSFSMFDTQQSDFKITNPQGAYRRWIASQHPDWTDEQIDRKTDIIGQLAEAVHAAGLGFGIYYSEPDWIREAYRIGLTGKNKAGETVSKAQQADAVKRYQDFMHAQLQELMTRYGKIDILWLDAIKPSQVQANGWDAIWIRRDTLEMIRRHQPGILINDRHGFEPDYCTPENSNAQYLPGIVQESCQHVGRQWAWSPDDHVPDLKWFIDRIVINASRNSNILMNMGPSPSGTFDPNQAQRLREAGQWLKEHAASLYGTRVGPVVDNRDNPAFVTTQKGSRIYIHVLRADQASKEIGLPGVQISAAFRFDHPEAVLEFRNENEAGYIQLPAAIDALDEIITVEGRFETVRIMDP